MKTYKYWLVILCILLGTSLTRATPIDSTKVQLPIEIARKVLFVGKENKRLTYELSKADSTVIVYETELNRRGNVIKEYYLTVEEYKMFVKLLQEDKTILAEKNKNHKKEINRQKRQKFVFIATTALEFALILLIII